MTKIASVNNGLPGSSFDHAIGIRMSFWLCSLFFLVTGSPFLFSQGHPHPSFRQYTTDHGLPSSEVYSILQDREGFIWISTDNGVSRFNGYEFQNYGFKEGLRENVIFEMQLDASGRIWMQAMSGNLYYFEKDTIIPYQNNDVLNTLKGRLDISKGFIVKNQGDTMQMATIKYGIISVTSDGKMIIPDQNEIVAHQVLEHNGRSIFGVYENDDVRITENYNKDLTDNNLTGPVHFFSGQRSWKYDNWKYSKRKGNALGGFYLGNEVFLFQKYHEVWLVKNGQVIGKHYYPFNIRYARLMSNGQLFVGLLNGEGVKVYDSLIDFPSKEQFNWLRGSSVSFFLEDHNGGKWFATNENGIFYSPADFMVYSQPTGLPNDKVTALSIKNQEGLFAGFGNGAVWYLDFTTRQWSPMPKIPGHGHVRVLHFENKTGQLWAGRNGLYLLYNKQWRPSLASSSKKGPITGANRLTISPDKNRFWVCNHAGFMAMDPTLNRSLDHNTGRDQRTYIVLEDFTGKIWVGQNKGLFQWENGQLNGYQAYHPAFALRIEDITQNQDSTLVIATKGGGIVFWKENSFEQLTVANGLTANMLENLYTDKKGIVWAGTLNGLNRISGTVNHRKIEQITVSHGLPSNEVNCIATTGEWVYVGTNKGLVLFPENKPSAPTVNPFIGTVLVNNQPVDLQSNIRLKARQNNLNISYLALNYKMNGDILYRSRLNGGEWNRTANRNLNYPALPPGNYDFEVQAINEDGAWSDSSRISFIIDPPWWATWWARTILAALIFAIGLVVYLFKMKQLKEAHQIEMQIQDLERSALQAQMNPHFIFNCLNSIQNFILQNEKQSAIVYLGRFASLIRSMLNASVAGRIPLNEEIDLLNNYMELEKLRFKNRFDFKVAAENGLDTYDVEIPPLLIQPLVENAIKHGISGKEKGGFVEVVFRKKDEFLEINVSDNGKGFDIQKKDENKKHKSFGMSITRNRLELLSEIPSLESFETHQIKDDEGNVAGTRVILRIRQ